MGNERIQSPAWPWSPDPSGLRVAQVEHIGISWQRREGLRQNLARPPMPQDHPRGHSYLETPLWVHVHLQVGEFGAEKAPDERKGSSWCHRVGRYDWAFSTR